MTVACLEQEIQSPEGRLQYQKAPPGGVKRAPSIDWAKISSNTDALIRLTDCPVEFDAHKLNAAVLKSSEEGKIVSEFVANETCPIARKLLMEEGIDCWRRAIKNADQEEDGTLVVEARPVTVQRMGKTDSQDVSVVDSSPTPYTAPLQLSTTLGSPQGATSLRLSYATPSPLYPMLNTGSHVVTAAGALSEGPAVGVSRPNADVVPPEAVKLVLERTHYLTTTAL
ncbi:hypothetical protein Bbelb_322250 [Branchiostoma belcheri]|nr:hypothetical protein Bbelb_322250 [Branchiostoma belcheri]